MEHSGTYAPIPALDRAGELLRLVLDHGALTARELSRLCGYPRTSFYRMLESLVGNGFLCVDRETGAYYPGGLFTAAYMAADQRAARLRLAARPALERLAAETGQTAKLSFLSGGACYVAETALGPQSIKVVVDGGSVYPLHAGAASRLLLAAQGARAVHRYFQGLPRRYTPLTITEEAAFLAAAGQAARQGYAYDPGEFTPEISAVACPVAGEHGQTVAAMSVVYPTILFRAEDVPALVRYLRPAAEEASRRLRALSAGDGAEPRAVSDAKVDGLEDLFTAPFSD